MSIFGWSYPAGAEHDLRAPWNAKDEPSDCETCGGTGRIPLDPPDPDPGGPETDPCPTCLGMGELLRPTREEIAIDKADRDRDAAKDEPNERD